jgi:hypothetical protein
MQRSARKPIVAKVTLPGAEQRPHVVLCFVLAHKRLWCNVRRNLYENVKPQTEPCM